MPEPDEPDSRCLYGSPIAANGARLPQLGAIIAPREFGLSIPAPDDASQGHPRIKRASKWHRHRNIQRVSTITTQLLTIMRPRITIIRRSTITRSASMKRPRSTPRQLRSIASLPTSIRRTLTPTLINDVTARGREPSYVGLALRLVRSSKTARRMAREIMHSLIDMVLEQDEKHQEPLLAHIVGSLADEYLKRRGLIQSRRRDN